MCHRLKIDITRVKEAVAYHREDILNQEGQYLSQNSYSRVSQEDVDQRVVQTQTVQVPQVTQGAAKISPKMSPTPATK